MRIAQVAPLYESVPPKAYGGTERVVSYLTEELVRQGHQVTLFASGDSETAAELVPCVERSLRLDDKCVDSLAHHILMLERVMQRESEFDIVHFHVDYLHIPVSRRMETPHVTTLHGRLDLPDLPKLYDEFGEAPVVSISDSQREPLPQANWRGTIYHGLPQNMLRQRNGDGGYFAFLGRISPEKRVDRAIEISRALGVPLRIAAKVDRADVEYFRDEIEPLLSEPRVEFIGEIGELEKAEFLGNARALLFPIDWPEPFGLVMIEAMACGTPVVALRRGSVPEIIQDGVTGFAVDDMKAAIEAAARVGEIDRRVCRATFERRFSAARMARDYVDLYSRLIDAARTRERGSLTGEAAA
jgi:glycosyltransferase involved in cell wall biosynthesis